jgi:hypothetical protein
VIAAPCPEERSVRTVRAILVFPAILIACGAVTVPAAIVVPDSAAPPEAQVVLDRIARAFEAGDHAALAVLVHRDGVRVGLAPQPERRSELSAAQAHYYFKTLFQVGRTIRFDYLRESLADEARVHAVAVWRQEQSETGRVRARRLLFTLALEPAGWRLTEIMTLRGG